MTPIPFGARVHTFLLTRGRTTRLALCFLAGLGAGLSFAPLYLVPLWPLGFGLSLFYIYEAPHWRQRLSLSFAFTYGSMLTGLYWIALAPSADPQFYFLIPLALLILPAFVALFGTLALFLAGFWRRGPLAFALAAVSLWLLLEWRRGIDLTGFGWNRAGMIWSGDPHLFQAAAWGGVPLLSLMTLLTGAGIFLGLQSPVKIRGRALSIGLTFGPVLLLLIFGLVRLAQHPQASMALVPDVQVRLVQANISPFTLNSTEIYERHISLSTQGPLQGISHVIWPEGSVLASLDVREDLRADLAERLAPAPYSLVFGRRVADLNLDRQTSRLEVAHLSAYLINNENLSFSTYDKVNLVPFGEYIPYPWLFKRLGFSALTGQFFGRLPGSGPQTLEQAGSSKIGVFICYDSIYTGNIVDPENRPDWLATLTEDAWYILPGISFLSKTPGPYQHLAESRMRAVEEGLAVARASNPGISKVIDPLGRSWGGQLNLGQTGTLDSTIPASVLTPFYARLSPSLVYVFFVFLLGFIAVFMGRSARL